MYGPRMRKYRQVCVVLAEYRQKSQRGLFGCGSYANMEEADDTVKAWQIHARKVESTWGIITKNYTERESEKQQQQNTNPCMCARLGDSEQLMGPFAKHALHQSCISCVKA